jgi:hypothetical protein
MGIKDKTNTTDHCARVKGTTLNIAASGSKDITIICRKEQTIKERSSFILEKNPIFVKECSLLILKE